MSAFQHRSQSRRRALRQLGALALCPWLPACAQGLERGTLLRQLVQQIVVPDAEQLLQDARVLQQASTALAAEPNLTTENDAQRALRQALRSWKQAAAFRTGPLTDHGVFVRAMFWPARTAEIDAVLSALRVVDAQSVAQWPAHAKGLYGIEYVLFGRSAQPWTQQALHFLRYTSQHVLGHAERGRNALGDGDAYGAELVATDGGSRANFSPVTSKAATATVRSTWRSRRYTVRGRCSRADWPRSSCSLAQAWVAWSLRSRRQWRLTLYNASTRPSAPS